MKEESLVTSEFLTVNEVAERLNIHRRTVYRLLHLEVFKSARIGGSIRIPRNTFEAYLKEIREAGLETERD